MKDGGAPVVGGNNAHGSISGAILSVLASPILWSVHFFLVYGLQSALCGHNAGRDANGWGVSALVIAATLVVLSAQLAILLRPQTFALLNVRSTDRQWAHFAVSISRFLSVLAMLGVAWAGSAALLLEPCTQLR